MEALEFIGDFLALADGLLSWALANDSFEALAVDSFDEGGGEEDFLDLIEDSFEEDGSGVLSAYKSFKVCLFRRSLVIVP